MGKYIPLLSATLLLFAMLLFGCSHRDYTATTPTDTEYSADADNVNPTASVSQGSVVSGTESGNAIDNKGDSTDASNNTESAGTTLPYETTPATNVPSDEAPVATQPSTTPETEPTVDKADTSGMDFSFDEEDISVTEPTECTTVDGTENATQPDSDTDLYNITAGGTYSFSGNITDTMVTIDVDNADVTIILNGVTITNSEGPAIYIRSADKVTITLASGTINTLSDGSSYSITDSNSTLDAAIFSKADLTINGSGTLNLTGNYKHGIVSKDDLIISSGTIHVTAKKVGINGKDCVKINSGNITINAGSDGIRSDNTEDTSRGYVYLYGGTVNITAGNDGIQAETVINIENVFLTVTAGGGSSGSLTASSDSYKGLKAESDIYITGGTFYLDTKDDCIHSNGTITISGGTYTLSSGDDGIHADTDLAISGSATTLTINKSYEGIEATNIVITGGNISITATDDGINAAGGNNVTSTPGGRPGQNNFSSSNGSITISGGTIYIKMSGDGLDANGTLSITGGSITISGANSGDTSILDFDSTGIVSGGTFIGTGASGMAQNFSASSTQGALLVKISGKADTLIQLTDSSGNVLISHTADQAFSCIIISCAGLAKGNTYTLTVGSSSMTITMNSTVYTAGNSGSSHGRK